MNELNDDCWNKLSSIFKKVFNDDALKITLSTNSQDIEGWDSITNIELFLLIEEQYAIKFSSAEVRKVVNVGELYNLIKAKQNESK